MKPKSKADQPTLESILANLTAQSQKDSDQLRSFPSFFRLLTEFKAKAKAEKSEEITASFEKISEKAEKVVPFLTTLVQKLENQREKAKKIEGKEDFDEWSRESALVLSESCDFRLNLDQLFEETSIAVTELLALKPKEEDKEGKNFDGKGLRVQVKTINSDRHHQQ